MSPHWLLALLLLAVASATSVRAVPGRAHEAPVAAEVVAETTAESQAEEADVSIRGASSAETAAPLRAADPRPQRAPSGDPPTRPPRR